MRAMYTNNETTSSTKLTNKKGTTIMNAIALIAALRQYIIAGCEARDMNLKPCAKTAVYAMLITLDGEEYFGANWMTNCDVTVCPRLAGDGYDKCKTVCNQAFHAECSALADCNDTYADNSVGGEVFIVGHTICCDNCQKEMANNGIVYAASLDSGNEYRFNDPTAAHPTEKEVRTMVKVYNIALGRFEWVAENVYKMFRESLYVLVLM